MRIGTRIHQRQLQPRRYNSVASVPMTLAPTASQRSNGAYCISLTDNGSDGTEHSGPAELLPNNGNPGYFTVVDGLITVTFTYPSGEGDCCDFQVFTAHASNGQIGSGVYNYFGLTDIGLLNFGKKNGCTK